MTEAKGKVSLAIKFALALTLMAAVIIGGIALNAREERRNAAWRASCVERGGTIAEYSGGLGPHVACVGLRK